MEATDPGAVFSSIDHGGRYAYGNQPHIARWNLARLAETLLPLLADGDDAAAVQLAVAQVTAVIDAFPALYHAALLQGQRAKLGMQQAGDDAQDRSLAEDWLALLHAHQVDFTLAWRRLADAAAGDEAPLRALFAADVQAPKAWLARWRARCAQEDGRAHAAAAVEAGAARAARMRAVNPLVIPRNLRVEEALEAASGGHLAPFENLLAALRRPYDDLPGHAAYAEPAPVAAMASYQTFCGT